MKNYVRRIVIIIFLMAIPSIASLPINFKDSIAWVLGAIASALNFVWMAKIASESLDLTESGSKIRTIKGFYLRYALLLCYAFIVTYFLKPSILVFGLSLLSAQIAIYLEFIYQKIIAFRKENES